MVTKHTSAGVWSLSVTARCHGVAVIERNALDCWNTMKANAFRNLNLGWIFCFNLSLSLVSLLSFTLSLSLYLSLLSVTVAPVTHQCRWPSACLSSLPAMQWHAHKRLFAFLSGNLAPLFLRLQYVLNVFIFLSFVKSLSMPIDSLLTTIFFLETKSLPSIPTKRYESEPDLPKPKLLLPNAGRSNRHCLSIEKTSNRQRRGKLTMSSRLASWSPRLC